MRPLYFAIAAMTVTILGHPAMAQGSVPKTQTAIQQNGKTAPDSAPLSADARAAVEKLRNAGLFATGGVGITGKRPPAADVYFSLLKDPQGAQAFRTLLKAPGATPEARAFALSGLARLAPVDYDQLVKALPSTQIMVRTAAGCLVTSKSLTQLAQDFKKYAAQERTSQTETNRKL